MIARSRISLIDSKMAACAGIDPEVASLFGETSDEESFDGFGEGEPVCLKQVINKSYNKAPKSSVLAI